MPLVINRIDEVQLKHVGVVGVVVPTKHVKCSSWKIPLRKAPKNTFDLPQASWRPCLYPKVPYGIEPVDIQILGWQPGYFLSLDGVLVVLV